MALNPVPQPGTPGNPVHLGGALIGFPPRKVEPCPATATAVLGMVGEPADVRCGLLKGHSGRHRMSIEWGDGLRPGEWRFTTGREPQPSDGPDYHADHEAWVRRVTTDEGGQG